MSRVNSRVVFIIHSDLPSVPLLLLTHPGFALPKLLGYSWYSLPPDIPQQASPSDISFVSSLYNSLICLIHNYMSKPILTHFFVLIILFFSFFFCLFFKIGVMGTVPCGRGEGAKEASPIQTLCIKPESNTRLHSRRKPVYHSLSRCDEDVWSARVSWSREKSAGRS